MSHARRAGGMKRRYAGLIREGKTPAEVAGMVTAMRTSDHGWQTQQLTWPSSPASLRWQASMHTQRLRQAAPTRHMDRQACSTHLNMAMPSALSSPAPMRCFRRPYSVDWFKCAAVLCLWLLAMATEVPSPTPELLAAACRRAACTAAAVIGRVGAAPGVPGVPGAGLAVAARAPAMVVVGRSAMRPEVVCGGELGRDGSGEGSSWWSSPSWWW